MVGEPTKWVDRADFPQIYPLSGQAIEPFPGLEIRKGRKPLVTSLSGEGKVYKGQQFIANVHYELEIHSHRAYCVDQDVLLRINPASAVGGQFDAGELLTLHMSDGRKQEFLVTSSEGACQPTGGPHE